MGLKIKHKILIIISLLVISLNVFSQTTNDSVASVRNISFELLGNGTLYSIKYENKINKLGSFRYNLGGAINGTLYSPKLIICPEINYLFGKHSHKFELGGGINNAIYIDDLSNQKNINDIVYLNCRIGYRFEGEKNIFKIGITPIIPILSFSNENNVIQLRRFVPWVGIGYGRKI